ncbi:NADH-dependent phenylglyoxylate dehydrogenase subunit beta [Sporomusa silvacetica DSM 10669]|uniref:NADH-dependent phenylglyoxylate dehydrogenase subunit beta n=1 Tax=Sporomusa silvacetica DSM 10669 TaxID=1123289 RepID=A0ABZ3IVK4_9FIRM|nr:thiamine pyrophosphate-dependent enzyme [Sporomusa silvacetica]OZC14270.1 NADH-dependent phenylglyoxylate dehydrogenase subunit beta [Sporomusa silvacetica DSM 10669]
MNYIDFLLQRQDLVSPGISACPGCAAELALRTTLKVLGENTIMGIPPGCMAGAGCVGWNYDNGLKVPVHISLLDNTASLLAGVKAMYEEMGREVHVVGFAGDGASADCGFQSLSGAAERGDNIIYICYDNEGYMNTGFQRSSTTSMGSSTTTTPVGAASHGKTQHKKDLPMIMAMHNCAYVATLSPAYMADFVAKIQKAMTVKKGLSYLHIFTPCPTGWGVDAKLSIELAKKAIQTNFFPLYEVENGKFKINMEVKNPQPVTSLLRMLKKFKHVSDEEMASVQELTDSRYKVLKALASAN